MEVDASAVYTLLEISLGSHLHLLTSKHHLKKNQAHE